VSTSSTSVLTRPFASRVADREPNRALILVIILATYLMIILDASIVITALPNIHEALGFSSTGLSWVQNAYTLTFGGLLLLGARAGDILGRRRTFLAGIAIFTAASLLGGLAPSASWLLAARAAQGIGAAIAAPAALALLMTTFPEGAERTRALAMYSAVASGGGSIGLVLGGMLTDWVSWRWGLFINVPVGIALATLALRHLPETPRTSGHFDLAGAITSTLGMTALVYGFVRAASDGWTDSGTLASFVAGAAMLAAFVQTERRAGQPITPLRLFRSRERSGAYAARVLLVGGMFGMFFFVTQYLQGVLGFSALQAGLAFLPMSVAMFAVARAVPRYSALLDDGLLLTGGVALALAGMAWLSQISVDTAYFPGLAIPMLLLGIGMGAAFTPLTAAGLAGVAQRDAGAASGLVNVAHQLGGSLGIGVLVTVFAAAGGSTSPSLDAATARHDLAGGIATALTGSALLMAASLAVIVVAVWRPTSVREAVFGSADAMR
jgi:EmrB/QacA subfamily drug resistance transporter